MPAARDAAPKPHRFRAFERASNERRCHLLTLLGEAGIGKSRLAEELRRRVGDGAATLAGRCPADEAATPLRPLYEIVRGAAGEVSVPALAELLAGEDDARELAEKLVAAFGAGETDEPLELFWAFRRLFEKDAPKTVQNFTDLAEGKREWVHPNTRKKSSDRLYDGTIFHRVIPNFMIQGGDPQGTGMGGPGYQFEDETRGSSHKFDKPGKLAMANSGPNTNGSQFFITVAPTDWLTGKHTIFGEVIEGQDVVDKIANLPRGRQDRPNKDVKLQSVEIERV